MLIGELASSLGVTTKTLRHYEAIGLVPKAQRAGNSYRVYSPEAIAQARLVVGLRALGLSIEQIQGVLADRGDLRRQLLGLLDQQLRDMSLQIAVLQGRHDDLEARYRALLDDLRRSCACAALLRPCDCPSAPSPPPARDRKRAPAKPRVERRP